jgi:hypothetical protein
MAGFLRPPCQRAHKSSRLAEGLDVEAVTHQPAPQLSDAAYEWFDRNQSIPTITVSIGRNSVRLPSGYSMNSAAWR